MKINIIDLPYTPYAVLNLFESLSNTEWSMLLYSGHKNKHPDSRFDILVSSPILTLITKNNITKISFKKKQLHMYNNTDPFSLLKKNILPNMQINYNHQLPFQGGYLGIFGYDLAKHIESLPIIDKKGPFFPDMAIGLYRWTIISDHKLCRNYLISHDNPNPLLSWIQKQQKIQQHRKIKHSFQLLKSWTSNMSKSEYSTKFNIVKKNLISGNCYQVCLSQQLFAPYVGDEWIAFCHLLNYNQGSFSAFIRLPNQLSILSLSPERFLQLDNKKIKTQPIKGTFSRCKNAQKDKSKILKLSTSIKNRAENLMIVDLLRNDIGKVAIPGSIRVPKLFDIQSFPNVHHMVSTVIGQLDHNFSAYDLLKACFPGGSITGAPKIQAMKIIEELEPNHRNMWSGSIGYISCCGNMDTNIAIRTLLANKKYIFCPVGSGIVIDSDINIEYQEMNDKISTLIIPLLDFLSK